MGHKYQIDVAAIAGQINSAVYEQTSGYNDGFIGWGYKQDLYRLRCILDDALKRCPSYGSLEQEWLHEQEQKKIIKILSND
jgi:predicted glycosyltransferase involved in capsule biosynthesis